MADVYERAKSLLTFQNLSLRSAEIAIFNDYEPFHIDELTEAGEAGIQTFSGVEKINEITFDSHADDSLWGYIFHYSAGVRVVDGEEPKDDDESNICLLIQASFTARYGSKDELSQECLDAFSENNVGYHVWPYWREFVHSSSLRLGVRPLAVPFYQLREQVLQDTQD
ncbi:MAG: hypothetical protein ACJAYF_002665 [Arenicella sp.]|jgi:hypothetical protein